MGELDPKDTSFEISIENLLLRLNPLGSYILDLQKRVGILEADLKHREDIENRSDRYED